MRGNGNSLFDKRSNSNAGQNTSDPQNEYTFQNTNYIFPNDVQICKKYKSFVTPLEINGGELSEFHNRKLSWVNRSHYVIKLKQIKKDEYLSNEDPNYHRYALYYEAIPYCLSFVKMNELTVPLSSFKIEKAIKEVMTDLIQFNIYLELSIDNCGFTEHGEFRVYVPPINVLNQRKLNAAQKLKMNICINNIVKFWQSERSTLINSIPNNGFSTSRHSYRFNSPQIKKDNNANQIKMHRNSEQNSDIKKTIKLTKNYIKDLNEKGTDQKANEKMRQLKKHKSMGIINKQQSASKPGEHFFSSKIEELNKKLINIREALISKKSTDHPRQSLQNFISREKQKDKQKGRKHENRQQQNYLQEIIFQKKEVNQPNTYNNVRLDEDQQSVDTYLQQIGHQYKMPKFTPNSELRNTTLPTQLKMIKNNLQGKEKQGNKSNWHHESAGNVAFKRFIQKNRQIYPELGNEPKSPTSLSKISAPGNYSNRKSKGFQKQLKKMGSLQNFQSHVQTKSINLSQFSNDLSNVKRRRQKQAKSKQIQDKIQDILMKSKKAIEQLKNPITKLKK